MAVSGWHAHGYLDVMVGLGWYAWMVVGLVWWVVAVETHTGGGGGPSLPDDWLTLTLLMTLQYSFMLLFIISAAHLHRTLLTGNTSTTPQSQIRHPAYSHPARGLFAGFFV